MFAAVFDFKNFIDSFWLNFFDGLSLGAIYALVALGYTLVYGVLRLINFANSEVFMLGTFGSIIAVNLFGGENLGTGSIVLTLVAMFVLSVLFAGGAAVLLEFVAYRPLRKRNAPRLVFLISAIGASLAMAAAVERFGPNEAEPYSMTRPWKSSTKTVIGFGEIQVRNLVVFFGALLMMALLTAIVTKTRLGRGMRAVAQDSETARILGVNVNQVIVLTFLLGGLMAGAAAFLYMFTRELTTADVGFLLGVKSFTAAVLGGIGNIKGALVGGLVLGVLETVVAGGVTGEKPNIVAFLLLVIVLMFRPTGLLGESLGRARA
jgi:branched-chain amino acid transport system permease protein